MDDENENDERLTRTNDPVRLRARVEAFRGCAVALDPLGALPPEDTRLVVKALWELYGGPT